jgi:large subunit ribosomal protein L17
MRHQKSGRKLKRTSSHRKATLAALSTSVILHKKIRTTVAKAKEARMVVEKLVTRAKNAAAKESDSAPKQVAARRVLFAFLRNKAAVSTLFKEIAPKVANRPGGYTRVVKLGRRHGDGAELAILELVDFNVGQDKAAKKASAKKKESTKARKKVAAAAAAEAEKKSAGSEHAAEIQPASASESSERETHEG